jgi:hypothetical protein
MRTVSIRPHTQIYIFQTLKLLYGKILRDLKKIPETASYRKYTEDTINSRLQHVESVGERRKLISEQLIFAM